MLWEKQTFFSRANNEMWGHRPFHRERRENLQNLICNLAVVTLSKSPLQRGHLMKETRPLERPAMAFIMPVNNVYPSLKAGVDNELDNS